MTLALSSPTCIAAEDAVRLLGVPGVLIVDVRPQVRRHEGSIPGALVVEAGEIEAALDGIPRGTQVVVVDVASRAHVVADAVIRLGFDDVSYVAGSVSRWVDAVNRSWCD